MGNLSIGQLLILIFIGILIFGDLSKIIKNLTLFLKKQNILNIFEKKNRKKRS